MEKRLRPKYRVYRLEGGEYTARHAMESTDPDDVNSPFVLMPRKDPAAFAAMITYAMFCEPSLSAEIKDWLRKIADAELIIGTQGERNFKFTRLRATNDIV